MPDISYDLDGDGYVGGRDLVISKVFDQGSKGRLTDTERKRALEAVKNGLEDNYVWNVEVCGSKRPYRLMQKRGVFVDSDDFGPVTGTYPEHPSHKTRPQHTTAEELKQARKQ